VKADNARAAGYAAVIAFNLQAGGAAPCQGLIIPIVTTDIPFLFVTRSVGLKFLGTFDPDLSPCVQPTPPPGSQSRGVSIELIVDGWGYVRMLNARQGFGDLTVHEGRHRSVQR
jgi:hypothetical protein